MIRTRVVTVLAWLALLAYPVATAAQDETIEVVPLDLLPAEVCVALLVDLDTIDHCAEFIETSGWVLGLPVVPDPFDSVSPGAFTASGTGSAKVGPWALEGDYGVSIEADRWEHPMCTVMASFEWRNQKGKKKTHGSILSGDALHGLGVSTHYDLPARDYKIDVIAASDCGTWTIALDSITY